MSVDINAVLITRDLAVVYNERSGTHSDHLRGLGDESNPAVPGFAADAMAASEFYGERHQFEWTSLAPSFNHTATAGDLLVDSCVGDIAVLADPDLNTGAVSVNLDGDTFTVGSPLTGFLWVRAIADMDNTGGGAAEWDFFLLKNGASVAGTHHTEWNALNKRLEVKLDFKYLTVAGGDEFCFAGQPSAGSETLIIRRWLPQFVPVRQVA